MRRILLCLAFGGATALPAAPDLDAAIALFRDRKYPDARAALEKIVAAEPRNAAAAYHLGRTIEPRGDLEALPEALRWYAKAIELEPDNATYLARYGGASLQLARRSPSLGLAIKGRDAMEKAVRLNPDDLDAREGLMQFYQRAPFFVGGSTAKAAAQLEEIRRRDPDRATVLSVMVKASAKDYAGAFRLCDDVLTRHPANYTALYQYGRTAALSGENLLRGLERLKQCLTLPQPSPASPTHADAWQRIGNIEEKLRNRLAARAAYEAALKIDPTNQAAAAALRKL